MTELPQEEQPRLLVFSNYAFVLVFIITSSYHFISMLLKFYRGSLYAVGYDNQTYLWLKGVWFTMTLLWLSLLHNMISGVIDIPWDSLGISWLAIDIFRGSIDIFVLFGLTILTVLFCKKPAEKPIVELCEISDKYEKSALSKEHALEILKLVDDEMHKHRHFLDNALNIEKLAKVINAPSQYLSQAINQYRQINFYELIASYRIEYAKEILIHQPEKNILTVAMDAGFNAKSTFNKTFKKITGLTPSEYKKSNEPVSN
jgi:AraC-like DNA-binding protein